MSERANIFGRIREALRVSAPPPGSRHHEKSAQFVSEAEAAKHISEWLPAVGDSFEERVEMFRANALELKAEFQLLGGLSEMKPAFVSSQKGRAGKESPAIPANSLIGHEPLWHSRVTNHGYDVEELEKCDAGISECDALVAQTGSVLVSTRSSGGRALSVLPPHHLVLARRDQLLADLPEAFAFLKAKYGSNYPSFISFITGPSRTGDIERILVLGAHGPRKLTILCV